MTGKEGPFIRDDTARRSVLSWPGITVPQR